MITSSVAIQTVNSSGSLPRGVYSSVEFLIPEDFEGTIQGAAIDAASWQTIGPIIAPSGQKLPQIDYTITAGSLQILTVS